MPLEKLRDQVHDASPAAGATERGVVVRRERGGRHHFDRGFHLRWFGFLADPELCGIDVRYPESGAYTAGATGEFDARRTRFVAFVFLRADCGSGDVSGDQVDLLSVRHRLRLADSGAGSSGAGHAGLVATATAGPEYAGAANGIALAIARSKERIMPRTRRRPGMRGVGSKARYRARLAGEASAP
jgi:hypothetical protein